jgi:hypothetical protein
MNVEFVELLHDFLKEYGFKPHIQPHFRPNSFRTPLPGVDDFIRIIQIGLYDPKVIRILKLPTDQILYIGYNRPMSDKEVFLEKKKYQNYYSNPDTPIYSNPDTPMIKHTWLKMGLITDPHIFEKLISKLHQIKAIYQLIK